MPLTPYAYSRGEQALGRAGNPQQIWKLLMDPVAAPRTVAPLIGEDVVVDPS